VLPIVKDAPRSTGSERRHNITPANITSDSSEARVKILRPTCDLYRRPRVLGAGV